MPLVVMMLSLAPGLMVLLPTPATATPIVIDRFADGSTGARLNFSEQAWNDSLVLELPRGARIKSAELTVNGIEGNAIVANSTMDFSTDKAGADIWAHYNMSCCVYPFEGSPYENGWPPFGNPAALVALERDDSSMAYSVTDFINSTPPFPYPGHLFHFHPKPLPVVTYTTYWKGYGKCAANETATYQAEMWLYDHRSSAWKMKASYATNSSKSEKLEATFLASSSFVSSNGSVDVIIAGPHSLKTATGSDNGWIYTDYIALKMECAGGLEFPMNATLHLSGTKLNLSSGPLRGQLNVGDVLGFKDVLQAIIDAEMVMPGTLLIPMNISIEWRTLSAIDVGSLRVEYEPIVNAPPEWRGPAEVEVEEDSPWTAALDLGAAFSDDWNQEQLRFSIVNVSDPANLSTRISFGTTGNWTLMVRPAPDFFGDVTVILNATDRFDEVVTSPLVTVRVIQAPDRPSIEDPGELHVDESERLMFTPSASDPDMPDDVFTWSDGSDLLDVDPTTGAIDWTPGKDQVGTHRVPITVTDRFGLQGVLTLTIVVDNVNDPPVITSPLALEVDQDQPVVYGIMAADPDVPFGDVVSYSAFSEDIEIQCDIATGEVTFTPTNDNIGQLEISLRAQDKAGLKDDQVLVVTVRNVNDPPVLQDVAPQTHDQWEEVSLRLLWSDPDLSVAGAGERLTMTSDGPAWLAPDAAGWVNFTADTDKIGVWTVNYTVKDALGLADTVRVVWTIIDINDPPVITTQVPATVTAMEEVPFTLQLQTTDLDGDSVHWEDDSPLFVIGASDGRISFLPVQADVESYRVTITASDGHGGKATVSFDLVVANVNDPPVITGMAPFNGTRYKEGEAVSLMANATDVDGDALTYIWKEKGKELGRGGTFTTDKLGPGRHTITLAVTDGNATVERQLKVEVVAKEGGGVPILPIAIVILVAVVIIVVVAVAMRSRKGAGAFPEMRETASLAGTADEPKRPPGGAAEGEEPPKIEIEYREV